MKSNFNFSEEVRNEVKAAFVAFELNEVKGAKAAKAEAALIAAAAKLAGEAFAAGLNQDAAASEAAAVALEVLKEAIKEEKAAFGVQEAREAALFWTSREAEAREAAEAEAREALKEQSEAAEAKAEAAAVVAAGLCAVAAALRLYVVSKEEAAAKAEAREAAKAAKEAAKKAEAEASREAEAKASRAAEKLNQAKAEAEAAAVVLKEAKKAAKANNTAEAKAAAADAEAKEAEARRVLKEASEAASDAEAAAVNVYEGRRASNNISKNVGRADESRLHTAAEYCRFIAAAFAAGVGNEYIINAAAAYYADGHKLKRGEKETAAEYQARALNVAFSAVAKNTDLAKRAAALLASKNQLFKLLRAYQIGLYIESSFKFAKEVTAAFLAEDLDEAKAAEKIALGWKYVTFSRGESKYKVLAAPSYLAALEDEEKANARRRQRVKKYEAEGEGFVFYFKSGRLCTLEQFDRVTLADIYAAVSRRLQIEDTRNNVIKEAREKAAEAAANNQAAADLAKAAALAKAEETRAKLAVIFENCGGDLAKFKKASEEGRRVLRQQIAAAGLNEAAEAYLIMCK